jgi:hypothetical protein
MENQIALAALMRWRAEKAGRIDELEKEIETLRVDLVHLDSVILDKGQGVIDPEAIPSRHRFPRKTKWFAHREVTRIIYDVLRPLPEGEAVPARTIVDAAMRLKGFNPEADRGLRGTYMNKFLCQLGALAARGVVEKIGQHKDHVTWRLPKINKEEAAD